MKQIDCIVNSEASAGRFKLFLQGLVYLLPWLEAAAAALQERIWPRASIVTV